MKKLKPASYFLIVIISFVLCIGIYSLTLTSMKSKLVPLIMCGMVLVLGGIQLSKELSLKQQTSDKEPDTGPTPGELEQAQETKSNVRGYLIAYASAAGLLVAIYLVGFLTGLFLFIVSFSKLHKNGWIMSIAKGIVAVGLIYLIFVVVLKVNFYAGIIPEVLQQTQ